MKDYIRGLIFAKGLVSCGQKINDIAFGIQYFESCHLGSLSPQRDFGSWLPLKSRVLSSILVVISWFQF